MTNTNDTLIKNGLMFIYARENKPPAEKILNIETILNDGAYINFPDANDNKNTILHIATQREEKDIVEFLLRKGALLMNNLDNKTPLQIAREKDTELSKEIFKVLTKNGKHLPNSDVLSSRNLQKEAIQNRSISLNNEPTTPAGLHYQKKRKGTSGVRGQFYETKLLSLVLHRALHDKEIEEYYLASNIDDIGDFDDVCFRFKIQEDGETKHVVCFTQAKHREDPNKNRLSVQSLEGTTEQFSLIKYFDSFIKIKQKFIKKDTKTYDPIFEGEFNNIECYFVLYTNLKKNFDRILTGNKPIFHKLHHFINTGEEKEDVFQFDYDIREINSLTMFMQQKCVKSLGKHFLNSILPGSKTDVMNNEMMKIYHPALAKNVIETTGSDANYFYGKFREEFFDSDDILLLTLKETLYEEIVMNQTKKTILSKEQVKETIRDIANNPCAQTISILIGEVLLFDDKSNKLFLDEKKIPKTYKSKDIREINSTLQKCQVTQAIVNDAINISGKDKLKSFNFKLPHTFGNYDFPKVKKKDRIEFIAKIFVDLINETKQHLGGEIENNTEKRIVHPVEICICDKNVGPDTLGIGCTVGNLLHFDKETQTYKFNIYEESLRQNSKQMLQEIRKLTNDDLTRYQFKVKMNNFPRTSFEPNENDKKLAEEFLSKLWFYTNQANEEAVESILKKEIDYHYNVDKSQNHFLFRVHSDALFLRFHDEIQKWWKSSSARYLTKADTIFDEAKKDIIDSPVLTVLNVMFIRSVKKLDIRFSADAINAMNLEKKNKNNKILNILSRAVILSSNKIMQLVGTQNNYTFVNLDYVHILPEIDKNKMMIELSETTAVTLVIICETSLDERHQNTINEIIKIYKDRIIVITDKPLHDKTYQNNEYIAFKDKNINLCDLHRDSQTRVLEEFKVCYQGKEVPLKKIIDEHSKTLIHGKFLWSILNKEKIEIGETLESSKYDEIKDYYVNRTLHLDDEEYEVNTLNDIEDKTVLITSLPCMGKTTLLTHLSLETKKIDPKPWIVRINMSAHNNDFVEWKLHVSHVMRFLCKDALKKTDNIKNLNFAQNANGTVELNREDSEDISYELEWFIHFFNRGEIIILFDGFDKIHPHFTKEGIELLLELKRTNKRMWITSNCYIAHKLEQQLGVSYKLKRLSTKNQESFLYRFWKTNLKLEKLNNQQINNVSIFLNYVMKLFNYKKNSFTEKRPLIHYLSIPLHIVYLSATEYFKNEINSLTPRFLREEIKKKWRLNSYTDLDRLLRRDEEESLELAGTPLHMYIAANYFKLQITDKFDLHINKEIITNKSKVYLNAMTSYELFLKNNITRICKIDNRNILKEQEKLRDEFVETHRKLALYAILKENDIPKLLTDNEISEVKCLMNKIESGEIKSEFIDCVVDDVPQFYNALFAEYFLAEFFIDFLKRVARAEVEDDIYFSKEPILNFLVNAVLIFCPPGVRKCFNYKLQCDPELLDAASNEKCDKIMFELILKQEKKAEIAEVAETCLDIAVREGLDNVTNILLKCARRHANRDNADRLLSILKSSASILGEANPSWKQMTTDIMRCLDSVDGRSLIELIESNEMESMPRTLAGFYQNTDQGQQLRENIKMEVGTTVKKLTEKLVQISGNHENIAALVEVLPIQLPEIVHSLFNNTFVKSICDKDSAKDKNQGNSSNDSDTPESSARMLE